MWFTVVALMGISVGYSILFLQRADPDFDNSGKESLMYSDIKAVEAAKLGILYNVLGLVTGMIWARVTWSAHLPATALGAWWVWEPIQICAVVSLLVYGAYFLLRSSFSEPEQRAKVSAVYNIFAFVSLIPLYFIIPKMLPGAHPTAAGSDQGGGSFILKGKLGGDFSLIFWPSIIGFILLAIWMWELRVRSETLRSQLAEDA
jgi:heme exporter protein C